MQCMFMLFPILLSRPLQLKVIPQFCIAHLYCAEFYAWSAHTMRDKRMHMNKMAAFFLYSLARDGDKLPFPCKQAWWRIFFMHNFGALMILFMLRKIKRNFFGQIFNKLPPHDNQCFSDFFFFSDHVLRIESLWIQISSGIFNTFKSDFEGTHNLLCILPSVFPLIEVIEEMLVYSWFSHQLL